MTQFLTSSTTSNRRIQKLKSGSEVAVGGGDVEEDRYIAPTVLKDVKATDPVMQDEVNHKLIT